MEYSASERDEEKFCTIRKNGSPTCNKHIHKYFDAGIKDENGNFPQENFIHIIIMYYVYCIPKHEQHFDNGKNLISHLLRYKSNFILRAFFFFSILCAGIINISLNGSIKHLAFTQMKIVFFSFPRGTYSYNIKYI